MESLFSLEVIVNYVKINNLKQSQCLFPSVAFRLLDYPTIAINLLDSYDSKELKEKLKLNEPFESIEKLPCFVELLDKHGRYIFSKGKSCLFRSDLTELKGHLKHAPMYLMILDTYFEPYKLIGTTLVPLTKLINEIYDETSEDSNTMPSSNQAFTPCIKMTHGIFDIRNLMGDEIGHISFACRLTSFGVSLLPHIDMTTEATQKMREFKKKKQLELEDKQKEKEMKQLEQAKEEEIYLYELKKNNSNKKKENVNALVQTLIIDYKDAQVQITDSKPIGGDKKDKSTQSPVFSRKNSKDETEKQTHAPPPIMYQVKHIQDEFVFNYFCPPPINYCSETLKNDETDNLTNIVEKKQYIQRRIEYLNRAARFKHPNEEEDDEESSHEDDAKDKSINFISSSNNYIDLNKSNDQKQLSNVKQIQNENILNNFSLNQTPLLKCLFDEITKLKNAIENTQYNKNKSTISNDKIQQHKEIKNQTKVVGILRNNKTATKKNSKQQLRKEHILETVNRLAQPKSDINRASRTKNNKELKSIYNFDEIPVRDENVIQPADIQPKKKKVLKYGLTNTHKMRVLASRPNQAKKIEKEHDNLLKQIKKNMDELSLIDQTDDNNTGQMKNTSTLDHSNTLQKNLEKILLFDSTGGSTMISSNNEGNNNTLKVTSGSMNKSNLQQLSLLNKVEMESTYGTYDFDTLNNNYKYSQQLYDNDNIFLKNNDEEDDSSESSTQDKQIISPTKVVQFGNTYIYNQVENSHSTEDHSSTSNRTESNNNKNNHLRESDNASILKPSIGNRNIFLENKYDDDFHSSLDSESMSSTTKQSTSTTTTSNFFTIDRKINNKQRTSIDSDTSYHRNNNKSPRSPRSPRSSPLKRETSISEIHEHEDLDEYDDIEYLTSNKNNSNYNNNNQSDLVTSSKLSTHSYNMHSFIDDENNDDDFK
jgi:hypothetical protein